MKKSILCGIGVAAVLCAGMLTVSLAASSDPGTGADPLVSKSYVDSRIEEAVSGLTGSQNGTQTGTYTPVEVTAGQTLLGGEGTEIILRSGKAVGCCPGENGIVDTTTAAELRQNGTVTINHLLIVPRNDGRGVTASTDAWFLVKGSYQITE